MEVILINFDRENRFMHNLNLFKETSQRYNNCVFVTYQTDQKNLISTLHSLEQQNFFNIYKLIVLHIIRINSLEVLLSPGLNVKYAIIVL